MDLIGWEFLLESKFVLKNKKTVSGGLRIIYLKNINNTMCY